MKTKQLIYKSFSYFLLVVFGFFLVHGFIPHHHHNNELNSSYSVHFCEDDFNFLDKHDHNSQGSEHHYCCLLCDQINAELYHDYLTTADNSQDLKLAFHQITDFTIYCEEIITSIIILESPILLENQNSPVGLRAPPVC